MTKQRDYTEETANLLAQEVGVAVSVLQRFRADARRALDELHARNADPAFIQTVRKTYAKAEATLQRLVIDVSDDKPVA
jgi:hypothetical protein